MQRKSLAAALALLISASCAFADESKTMFPFVVEHGAPNNITNVQTWDQPSAAAGSDGFLFDKDGEFTSKAGQTRLLGTNLCFGGSFAPKEKAERLAETLSRFGIGVVRLHHMDSRDIWGKNLAKGTTEIDPEKLERLDYLVYCLQQKGIYVNINLHVSRAFREIDGFEDADKLPTQNKGIDNVDRRMIELQKKYAKDLLQHVNPYTGKAYVDDPGVAVVEINNENSVVASWSWGELDDLPPTYAKDFQNRWNEWLGKKYGSTDALRKAWECQSIPLSDNMIAAGFEPGFKFSKGWNLENDATSKASYKILTAEESGIGAPALSFTVESMGDVAWRPQFAYSGLKLQKDVPYLVSFKLRSKTKSQITCNVGQAHEPWQQVGFSTKVQGEEEWKTVELPFISTVDDAPIRICFSGFQEGTSFELAEVSFRSGGEIGFPQDASLEDATIPVVKKGGQATMLGPKALGDFSDFLHDLEDGYWQEMFAYVKSLGTKSLATGTQLQYGFWYNQGRLDYCDIHAYWNHPNFPHKSWDSSDWLIKNSCLANSPNTGTLANLAAVRVLGRPFTCSEYDHPFPNDYCAEGNVMLAAVAAFQDWSATFQFAWSHGDNFDRNEAGTFFDECSQTVKVAHLPACYAMFVRGDVQSGPGEFYYAPEMSEEKEKDVMKSLLTSYHRSLSRGLDLDPSLSLAVFSGVDLTDLNLPKSDALKNAKRVESWKDLPERFGSDEKKEIVNEFGEITWNYQQKGKGYFTVDTANTKVFSGFVTAPQKFDGMTLDVGETELGWATVSLVKAKNAVKGEKKSGKLTKGSYLLTATGLMHNTDAKKVAVDSENITTASAYGGSNGVAPVLCEGVPATVALDGIQASDVEVYALTNAGERGKQLTVDATVGGCRFAFGPEDKTIWYEIVVK